jgi:hypothetical protein
MSEQCDFCHKDLSEGEEDLCADCIAAALDDFLKPAGPAKGRDE